MGRKRTKDQHLPTRVYFIHGAYYWKPPKALVPKYGKTAVPLGDTFPGAMQKWAEMVEPIKVVTTMGDLFDRYMLEVAPKKAPRTYKDNCAEIQPLRAFFGTMAPGDVTAPHVYQYIDTRGATAKTRANREKALLSHVFTLAIRWGVVKDNPCKGVKRLKVKKHQCEATEADYRAALDAAPTLAPRSADLIQACMEIERRTAMRPGDLLRIRLSDITDDGIRVEIGKSDRYDSETPVKIQVYGWSEALRKAVEQAKKIRRKIGTLYLFSSRDGKPYTESGFASIWQRFMRAHESAGGTRFEFYDIKRLALKAAERERGLEYARQLAAHDDQKTTRIYTFGEHKIRALD